MLPSTDSAAILLVEDDEAIREALTDLLVEAGHVVKCAEHGGQALALLQDGYRPELILLDLMMPVMDGWELMQRLEASTELAGIPVVIVSAARAGKPQGACRLLPKPVDIDAVLEAVQQHRRRVAPHLAERRGLPAAHSAGETYERL